MVGRPRSIDRDKVLDAAEAIVTKSGAGALSFEAVAKEAGITKSGVQYCFGTRDNLIHSMIERWERAFTDDIADRISGDTSPRSVIRAHVEATRDADDAAYSRSAVMMTAVLQHPDQVAATRHFYNSRFAQLDLSDPTDREAALALLAGEGAFFLRSFGLVDLDNEQWDLLFSGMLARVRDGETGAQ
ncbi:MAG: TetR family transcriptional regulator [Aliihoeflea sp.]